MSGELAVRGADHQPERHEHLILFTRRVALVLRDPRMFGRVALHGSGGLPDWWAALPVEILADGFTADYLAGRLASRRSQGVKALLLDQEVFPGIGNWMADEVLWRSGFHPGRPVSSLSVAEAGQLRRAARRVCRAALRVIGTDWGDPPRSWLFPHRWRNGGRCPRTGCGALLARAAFAGRTTCWCPQCQGARWGSPGV
jgi:formamidopyrimidine-DNA glycosylase